jgi:hypothetical protein
VKERTNSLFSLHYILIRHGLRRKHRVQQFYYCVCICCRGNVFRESLPSTDKGRHTDSKVISKASVHFFFQYKQSGVNTARGTDIYLYISALSSVGRLLVYRSSVQKLLPNTQRIHVFRFNPELQQSKGLNHDILKRLRERRLKKIIPSSARINPLKTGFLLISI